MGAARKLRNIKTYPQLRKIRGHGQKNKFNVPILIFAILILVSSIIFQDKTKQDDKENIKEFVEKSLQERTNKQKKYKLNKVTDKQAKEIFELTGIDAKGYQWVIENFFLYHTLKEHGNIIQEQKRGQIAINNTDFEKIPDIIVNPDKITLSKGKNSNIHLKIEKQLDELYFYIVEIRKGKKEIMGKTMYKRQ
ncbi:MAG: hypothetical protein L3J74_11710 [Bacteroidales bacterium]|nr:hypothetical protein [Bacteroidales bacterium]